MSLNKAVLIPYERYQALLRMTQNLKDEPIQNNYNIEQKGSGVVSWKNKQEIITPPPGIPINTISKKNI